MKTEKKGFPGREKMSMLAIRVLQLSLFRQFMAWFKKQPRIHKYADLDDEITYTWMHSPDKISTGRVHLRSKCPLDELMDENKYDAMINVEIVPFGEETTHVRIWRHKKGEFLFTLEAWVEEVPRYNVFNPDPAYSQCAVCSKPTVLGVCPICIFRGRIESMAIQLSVRGQPLEKPLPAKTLESLTKVNVVVPIEFWELLDVGLDALNNYMDEKILGPDFVGNLVDIHYNVVGHKPGKTGEGFGGTIYIWVQAEVERN